MPPAERRRYREYRDYWAVAQRNRMVHELDPDFVSESGVPYGKAQPSTS